MPKLLFKAKRKKNILFRKKINPNSNLDIWEQMVIKNFFLLLVNQVREQRKFRLGKIWQEAISSFIGKSRLR